MSKQKKTSKKKMLTLFFTWDVSLKIWKDKGLYDREIRFYQELAKKGLDITFITWGDKSDLDLAPSGIKVIPLYSYLWRPQNKIIRALLSLYSVWVLRKNIMQSDILKTNQMWGAWIAVFCKWIFAKPLIVRCGFELYDFTLRQGHGALRKALIWVLSYSAYKSADVICVATQEDKSFVENNFSIKPQKIRIHPNWIDTSFFAPSSAQKKSQSILFVGRLTEQKNLFNLLEAVKSSVWQLNIVGQGELRSTLEEYVANNNIQNVEFLGVVSNKELPAIYNSHEVYVLPSEYEGNPKTLLEAMSCGAAVVGTDVSGVSSVIKDQKSGLLCQLNADSIHQSLKRVLEDKKLRVSLGKRAREQIVQVQDLEILLRAELELCECLK